MRLVEGVELLKMAALDLLDHDDFAQHAKRRFAHCALCHLDVVPHLEGQDDEPYEKLSLCQYLECLVGQLGRAPPLDHLDENRRKEADGIKGEEEEGGDIQCLDLHIHAEAEEVVP